MSDRPFEAVCSSGDLRPVEKVGVSFGHRWTEGGVVVESDFTGGHLLNLAIAGCVLNDIYREAGALDVQVDGVRVSAWGDFDRETWKSTGIEYSVDISSSSNAADIDELMKIVDDVAEIPKAHRQEASVRRV